jgi:hypothetical protein
VNPLQNVKQRVIDMTEEQFATLRHMLGIDTPEIGSPKPYRNYYCACFGDAAMKELERIGMVRLYRTSEDYEFYETTDAGRAAAFESHRKVKLPKKKRMYLMYLRIKDARPDVTFREFLVDCEYSNARACA